MHKVTAWLLAVGGLIGLVLALGFEVRQTPDGPDFRMGYPDSWVVWESTPNGGHRYEMNALRWSFGILVAGVYSLYYAVRLWRRKATSA
jgi:hypothetical protein